MFGRAVALRPATCSPSMRAPRVPDAGTNMFAMRIRPPSIETFCSVRPVASRADEPIVRR